MHLSHFNTKGKICKSFFSFGVLFNRNKVLIRSDISIHLGKYFFDCSASLSLFICENLLQRNFLIQPNQV